MITRNVEKSQTISAPERSCSNSKIRSWSTVHIHTAGGSQVVRVPNEDSAALRTRWLAELADALDEARQLMKRLGAAEGRVDAVELYARIEAVRLEVQAMRLRRPAIRDCNPDPEWTKDFPWKCSA